MTISAAQAAAFSAEVTETRSVWTVRDDGGYPAPLSADGSRAQPFWSLRTRAERVVEQVPAYAGFTVVEVPLDVFRARWLPGLERDGVQVGVNWSGSTATGYNLPAADVERNISALEARNAGGVQG